MVPLEASAKFPHTHTHINICGTFNKFPGVFVQAFKIVVDS